MCRGECLSYSRLQVSSFQHAGMSLLKVYGQIQVPDDGTGGWEGRCGAVERIKFENQTKPSWLDPHKIALAECGSPPGLVGMSPGSPPHEVPCPAKLSLPRRQVLLWGGDLL